MPRRLTATRDTALTSSRATSRLCSPRTWIARSRSISSSPMASRPAPSVPVITVPAPRMTKERSTQSRTRPSVRGEGSAADQTRQGSPQRAQALSGPAGHRHGLDLPQRGTGYLAEAVVDGASWIGEVAARHHEQTVPEPEGLDRGEVLARLSPPALVGGDHEHHGRRRAERRPAWWR